MKNVTIRKFCVVGMHHTGAKQQEVGPLHYCRHEPGNRKDCNAIAVYGDSHLHQGRYYLRREDALKLKTVLNFAKGSCYLRAKNVPRKVFKAARADAELQHRLRCCETDADSIAEPVILKSSYIYKIY
ncbi:hypothetical protein DPMN_182447 [Dreissena polymorpha]|uniref:Uncharacterized protein n=1 Tax=Dreissena polymorpha TaxID=45954 RepID=A0A9D4DGH8_DREPO|nr:hypothetical protein DPMN_182447 [Dreissena polymorpha]